MRKQFIIVMASVLMLVGSGQVMAVTQYTITDIGAVAYVYALNDAGSVVGESSGSRPFLWQANSGMQDLGVLPGKNMGRATGINNSGTISGLSGDSYWGWFRSFTWTSSGGMNGLGTPPAGYPYYAALAINNQGNMAINNWSFSGPPSTMYLYSGGSYTRIPDLCNGTKYAWPTAINNANQVVGSSPTLSGPEHAFLWGSAFGTADLGTLGGTSSSANGINDSGLVVGESDVTNGRHAFVWSATTGMRDLGVLSSTFNVSGATGLNNLGQVVGWSTVAKDVNHAFIWTSNGGLLDLNNCLVDNAGWQYLNRAVDISNTGQIVGEGLLANGDTHAFLLTPVPVQKCSVTTGNNNMDGISFSGSLNAAESDFIAANVAVTISSKLMIKPKTFTFPIDATTYKKGKFSGKIPNGTFKFDTKKQTFSFAVKKTDLTGLACPITVTITIGGYTVQAQLDETIVNGIKKLIPFQLMMDVQNDLKVTKYKLKPGKVPGINTDTFTAQGIFTIDGTFNPAQPFVISIGSQTFTVQGVLFINKNGVYSCKNAPAAEGGLVTAKMDTNKCTFTLSITKANIAQTGDVKFELNCFGTSIDYSEDIDLGL